MILLSDDCLKIAVSLATGIFSDLIRLANFLGKDQLLNLESPNKLVCLVIDSDIIDVTGDEAVIKNNDECIGYITSGGYAHHVKKSMALGYVPEELSKHETTLDVEINGKLYLAHVTDRPLYDANGQKMRI